MFRETENSYSFSKKEAFVIFREMELSWLKIKKLQEGTFPAQNIEKIFLVRKMELSSPKLKTLLYFRR